MRGRRGWSWAAIFLMIFAGQPAVAVGPDIVVTLPSDDETMAAAIRRAQTSVDGFLAVWHKPGDGMYGFGVKLRIIRKSDGAHGVIGPFDAFTGSSEHFWVELVSRSGDRFIGAVTNAPEIVKDVYRGERVAFDKEQIEDWMYFSNGKVVGNATACPALAHANEAERRFVEENYGLTCDRGR